MKTPTARAAAGGASADDELGHLRRLAAQYAVTAELAGAASVEEAVPRVLRAVCESVGWEVGGLWSVDRESGVLRFAGAWHSENVDLAAFDELSRETTFERGAGMPGRVWENGEPAWTANVRDDPRFLRTEAAGSAGLHAGFFSPLALGDDVVGVAEFFSREIREPDEELIRMMGAIGSQIAQFLERKTGEDALRRSEARKSAVIEAALDCVIGMDHQGRIVEFNPAAENTFGYRREDVLGRDIADVIVPPALRDAHRRGRERYMATGEARVLGRRIELPGVRADGTEFPVELTITEVRAPGPPLFMGYLRDITERKRAEEGLAFLADASTVLASSLDYSETLKGLARLAVPRLADWCVVYLTGEGGTLERLEAAHADPAKADLVAELTERLALAPPSRVLAAMDEGKARLLSGIPDSLLETVAEDPEQLAILRELGLRSAMVVPFRSAGTEGAISFVTAESGRRYGEADLALAEEVARRAALAIEQAALYHETEQRADAARVLAHVADGVLLLDSEGIVRLWNPAAERIMGLPAGAVLGRRAEEVVPGWQTIRRLVRIAPSPARAAARPETVPVEVDGGELWLSISGVGFAEGTVYAFRDLSEERALDDLKTEFVATVSHELRTPLAAVYGAAMTLRRHDIELEEDQRQRLVGIVANEADRLARIVDDILWASRLDAGRVEVAIESCDVAAIASEVVEAARAHLREGVALALSAPPSPPAVAGDPDKIRQVLVNLVENAVKYSPEGGSVEVRLEPLERRLRVSVRDEGLGIPMTEQQRIFEKFYRLDPNLTRGVGGTGLGLYICRELVRWMNGRIWVASKEGQGSTFFVELPLADGAR